MKIIFLIILFFSITSNSYWISEVYSQNLKDNVELDYVKVYYPFTSKAKIFIVQNNYAEALKHYQKAFNIVRKGFAYDYYNAMVCCVLLEKYKLASVYIDTLLNKGIPLMEVEKKMNSHQSIFSDFFESKVWSKLKRQKLDYKSPYNRPNATFIRNHFTFLDSLDQKVRGNDLYRNVRDTIIFRDKIIITKGNIKAIDSLVISELKYMTTQYGIISEDIVGKKVIEDIGDSPMQLILLHYSYYSEFRTDFLPILLDAVKNGQFDIDNYMFLHDRNLGCPDFGKSTDVYASHTLNYFNIGKYRILNNEDYENAVKNVDWCYPKSYKEAKIAISAKRAYLGLESFDDHLKIALFAAKNQHFIFQIQFMILTANNTIKEKYKDKMIFIENNE
jgi:hypothetical protein